MKKKLLAAIPFFLLLAAYCTKFIAVGATGGYTDIKGHWAYDDIVRWSERGVLSGGEGRFRPDDGISLAELATVICRVVPLDKTAENTFSDVEPGAWFEEAVLKCAAAGIIDGSAAELHPREALTRADALIMLARAAGISPDADWSRASLSGYNDAKRITDAQAPWFCTLLRLGIIEGTTPVQLDPDEEMTRAGVAAVLSRLVDLGYITV